MPDKDQKPKIELHLTKPSAGGLAALFVKLTGRPLSPEGLAKLEAGLNEREGRDQGGGA
jgi:hypothetical protein